MHFGSAKSMFRMAAVAALAAGWANAPAMAQSGPFAALNGTWNGTGTISLSKGTEERLRCRASYAASQGGARLGQNLRCASDSYNFDLRAEVNAAGSSISGTWSEQTRNVGGNITGEVKGNRIQVLVDSAGFSATLTLVTQGDKQTVTIRSKGQDLTGAVINLVRH
jgi:hypothetical protein